MVTQIVRGAEPGQFGHGLDRKIRGFQQLPGPVDTAIAQPGTG